MKNRAMKKLACLALALTMICLCAACAAPEAAADGDGSWTYIEEKGTLIVGLDDTFAPMGFRDEAGELVGFDIDLANAVGEYLGVEVVFQPIDWSAKEMELAGKKIDCIWNGMSITPERQESMNLSNAYLNNTIILMENEGVDLTDKAQLQGLRIGTQAESSALEVLKADEAYESFQDNILEYATYDEALMDMAAGRLDVLAIDQVFGEYKNSKLETPYGVSPLSLADDLYAIGMRKGEDALTEKVNEALAALIENGTAAEISLQWFGKDIVIR